MTTLYNYPNCEASRKACLWLTEHDLEFELSKRPILDLGNTVLVGFSAEQYEDSA